jgi:hypothetical protein
VTDVDRSYLELKNRGVHFLEEPPTREGGGLCVAPFVDPRNNSYFSSLIYESATCRKLGVSYPSSARRLSGLPKMAGRRSAESGQ